MKFKVEELTPGGEDALEWRVEDYKDKLRNGQQLDAINVTEVHGRRTVRNGHHRVLATIHHCEALGIEPQIEGEMVSPELSKDYLTVCERIFEQYGTGVDAFKTIPCQ
jgi:hypothetical protein